MRKARQKWFSPLFLAVALLFGLAQVLGGSVAMTDSLAGVWGGASALLLSGLRVLGWAAAYYLGLALLSNLLTRPARGKGAGWLGRAAFGKAFACVAGAYLLWDVAFYPGYADWDTYASLALGYRFDAHPMLFNWLLGGFVALGRALGSENLGLFLFTLAQIAACAAVCAAVVSTLARKGLCGLAWAALLFYALTPMLDLLSLLCNKDTLFASGVCLLGLLTWRAVSETGLRPRFWLGYAALAVGVSLFRHGMAYVVFPVGLFTVLLASRGGARGVGAAGLVAGALLVAGFTRLLLPAMDVEAANPLEALCLPFQQAARVVRDAGDELTGKERAALDALLDTERMGDAYQPWQADTVKGLAYEKVLTGREREARIRDFLSVWKDLLLKHPRICLEAWMAQSCGYWTVLLPGEPLYARHCEEMNFHNIIPQSKAYYPGISFVQPEKLARARESLLAFARDFHRVPVLGLLHQCGFYTWLMAALACCLARARRRRLLAVFALPALIALVCTASPVNFYYRYYLPVTVSIPVLLACARHALRRPGEGENDACGANKA